MVKMVPSTQGVAVRSTLSRPTPRNATATLRRLHLDHEQYSPRSNCLPLRGGGGGSGGGGGWGGITDFNPFFLCLACACNAVSLAMLFLNLARKACSSPSTRPRDTQGISWSPLKACPPNHVGRLSKNTTPASLCANLPLVT